MLAGRKEWEQSQGKGRKGRARGRFLKVHEERGGQDTGLSALQHANEI